MRPEREIARFWSKTRQEDRGYVTSCLIWTGATSPGGYGVFHLQRSNGPDSNKTVQAHRYSFALTQGEGFLHSSVYGRDHEVDHVCRQTDCVQVKHLEWVTTEVNRQRMHDALRTKMCRPGLHLRELAEKTDSLGRVFCSACARLADQKRRRRARVVV